MTFPTVPADYLAQLGEHPLFQDLDPLLLADLSQVVLLDAGAPYPVPTERIVLVIAGRVAVSNADRFERLAGPEDVIGLIRPGHDLTLEALEDSALLLLGPIELGGVLDQRRRTLIHNVTTLAELEVHRIQLERREIEASLEDFFDPTTGEAVQAPYVALGAKLLMVVARDTQFSKLPPGLPGIPLSDGRFLLTFCKFPHFGPEGGIGASYEECIVLVPCWDLGGGGPGLYCPEVWPESMMAVIVGSELFGFAKRYGRVTLRDDHAHVDIDGTQAYVHWTDEKEIPVHEYLGELVGAILGEDDPEGRLMERLTKLGARLTAGPMIRSGTALPLYVRRSVGRRDLGTVDWDVDELAWVPFDVLGYSRLAELGGLDLRGWGRFTFVKPERAFLAEVDMAMYAARPVRDLVDGPVAKMRSQWMRWGVRKERLWATFRRSS